MKHCPRAVSIARPSTLQPTALPSELAATPHQRDGWVDEQCLRPLFCTIKAELGRGQLIKGTTCLEEILGGSIEQPLKGQFRLSYLTVLFQLPYYRGFWHLHLYSNIGAPAFSINSQNAFFRL